jgi:hypothetical protein
MAEAGFYIELKATALKNGAKNSNINYVLV